DSRSTRALLWAMSRLSPGSETLAIAVHRTGRHLATVGQENSRAPLPVPPRAVDGPLRLGTQVAALLRRNEFGPSAKLLTRLRSLEAGSFENPFYRAEYVAACRVVNLYALCDAAPIVPMPAFTDRTLGEVALAGRLASAESLWDAWKGASNAAD